MHACLCSKHIPSDIGGQKRISDILELEIQVVVSNNVGAKTEPMSSRRVLILLTGELSPQAHIGHFKR